MEHPIKNRNTEILAAFVFIVLGFFLLWDSYDNRGGKVPWFLQWLTFWG